MPATPPAPPAHPGTRRRLSAARRRDLILQAAAGVFAEQGYHGASMTAIAAAAGIAPSVIYDHFSSKKDLHLELLRRSTEAFFGYVEQNRFAWRMLFRDPPADEQIAAIHAGIHRRGTAAIAALIHRAPALRLPPVIPRERADEMIARAIKSGNDGLATWWYEHPEVPRDQVVEVAVSLHWHGLARLAAAVPGHDR